MKNVVKGSVNTIERSFKDKKKHQYYINLETFPKLKFCILLEIHNHHNALFLIRAWMSLYKM